MKPQLRTPVKSAKADIKGKNILFVGNPHNVGNYYAQALKDEGANVIFTKAEIFDMLTPAAPEVVAKEVETMQPKPDAVVVFHPHLKYIEGSFENDPTIKLAKAVKPHGVPVVVLDVVPEHELEVTEKATMRNAGISLVSTLDATPFKAVPIIAQTMADKGKPPITAGK